MIKSCIYMPIYTQVGKYPYYESGFPCFIPLMRFRTPALRFLPPRWDYIRKVLFCLRRPRGSFRENRPPWTPAKDFY
jgi:hypothetical protein